jgi:hypothetical protein
MSRLITRAPLTSDPTQYAFPLYRITPSTPRRGVRLSGYFSTYTTDTTRMGHGGAPTVNGVPVPADAVESSGTGGTILFWDPVTGDEWALWALARNRRPDQSGERLPVQHQLVAPIHRRPGRPRGRVPYFAGLVRPWEVNAGHIGHAVAFAYSWPSPDFVFPASKSDGLGTRGVDLPEGTRLRLDPSLTDADLHEMGLSPAARVVARALQEFGMIVVDNGSTKVMLEDNLTANWGQRLSSMSLSPIPLDKFRVLAP